MSNDDCLTQFGFRFGAAEVVRKAKLPSGHTCLAVETPYHQIELTVSPAGRSVIVCIDGKRVIVSRRRRTAA